MREREEGEEKAAAVAIIWALETKRGRVERGSRPCRRGTEEEEGKEVDEDESLGGEKEGGGVLRGREEREKWGPPRWLLFGGRSRKGERGERE